MDALCKQAVTAAVAVAGRHGLTGILPAVVRDGSNTLVHLTPYPVVARVATTTGWVRQPAEVWLRRDLEVAGYLRDAGFPVVGPATLLPAGPHVWVPENDGETGALALTFWAWVEHVREPEIPAEEALARLYELHEALRGFPGRMPYMSTVLDEIPHWLKWLEVKRRLSGQQSMALREAQWRLAGQLRPTRMPVQTLHGDAHRRNLLRTPQGLVWTDFEDTCTGPVAWDLAVFLSQEPGREEELLARYSGAPGWGEMLPYVQARELEAVVFMQVAAVRFAEREAGAVAKLEQWLDRQLR